MTLSTGRDFLFRHDESAVLAARLVACMPAATFEMEALCRLAGIKASRNIPTAGVECTFRPRLLINPDFVSRFCVRDEHLFLLVMHELWHVLLAHTRLYPRMTPAQNVAFDAVINAGLMRQFSGPEYQGLFDTLNPVDKFPHLLLRPPVGWPADPQYPKAIGPIGTEQILKRLYPPANTLQGPLPFYDEILDLLREDAKEKGYGNGWVEGEPVLLGDHDGEGKNDQDAMDNPFFKDVMKQLVGAWPSMTMPSRGRGAGGEQDNVKMSLGASTEAARRVFAQTLRRCLGPRWGRQRRKARTPIPGISGTNVLPNARDRLAPARRVLGAPDTLWNQPGVVKARVTQTPSKSNVYLDVSGSMSQLLPYLLALVMPYVSSGQAEIFQFSTVVEPLPLSRLQHGYLRTTGGTDINCVLDHILGLGRCVKRALVLTDGYTGAPKAEYIHVMSELNLRIHVVLPSESAYQGDLKNIARSITVLPPVKIDHVIPRR